MEITEYFNKAIVSYVKSPTTELSRLVASMESENVPETISTYLVIFIPLALSRIICSELGVNLPDEYEEHSPNGEITRGLLSEHQLYRQVFELSFDFIVNGCNQDLVFKIAAASPEFQVVNNALLKNEDLGQLRFSPFKIVL